jgi:hypothetical protein
MQVGQLLSKVKSLKNCMFRGPNLVLNFSTPLYFYCAAQGERIDGCLDDGFLENTKKTYPP